MKRIFDKDKIDEALSQNKYRDILGKLPIELFLTEYEEGEFLPTSEESRSLLQIVVKGTLSIYYIRDDGSSYALAFTEKDEILGQMEFFGGGGSDVVIAEVKKKLVCLALPVEKYKDMLLKDAEFLFVLAQSLTNVIDKITMQNAALPSLQERVYSYMMYRCEEKRLKGVENAAFHLHCSPRQLQRILNSFVENGTARKTGKGTYELCR